MKGNITDLPPGCKIGKSAAEALASHLGRGEPITKVVNPDGVQDIIDAIQGPTVVAAANLGKRKGRKSKVAFVVPSVAIVGGTLVITAAVETKNETNERVWRAKHRRAGAAWTAVRKAIGPRLDMLAPFAVHLAIDKPLRVKFIRLGGRKLDRSGIPAACKGVEDAVAWVLGIDDGSPLWRPDWDQEIGGATGVRIEVTFE